MTRRRLAWTLVILTGLCAATPPSAVAQEAPAPGEIQWRTDYAAALKEAQDKNLPLMVEFGTPNCYWCKKLDETTFRETAVITTVNEKFIPVKIDGDKEAGTVQKLRITSYPTLVLAAPDKRILHTLEGYQDTDKLTDKLQWALAQLAPPEWMTRDLQNAARWATGGDYARAIGPLRALLEDPKAKPLHPQAEKLLHDIEQKAAQRLDKAKQLSDQGKTSDAIETLTDTMRTFAGLEATRIAAARLASMVKVPEVQNQQRTRRARELLGQARDFYQSKDYILCLDRCEILVAGFGDLPEGQDAARLANDIKNNADWLQGAVDTMAERLGSLYLSLADSLLKRGNPQRAEFYLQRIIAAFPGSRHAESAQIRLTQLQSLYPRKNEVHSAGSP
jgi:thioredoxin-like negative regulator of GroEL